MSLLAPLYFLGALAIGLPILFHLIRRQPKGELPFSSLMFLRETPPRLTRRSRLENWPLLLIRALILALLAAAFARPLFRSVELADAPQTRTAVVLLVDTSASMKRSGLWEQALAKADEVIDDLQLGDQLAVVGFDQQPTTLFSFDQSSRTDIEPLKSAARNALQQVSPTWKRTDLGRAIRFAAELATSRDDDGGNALIKIVLISDMQQSSNVEALQAYSWPQDVLLNVRRVRPRTTTNASATFLTEAMVDADQNKQVRVRVTNAANSSASNFQLGWQTSTGKKDFLPVQVPPGQSRVVRLPLPDNDVSSLGLIGDEDTFDNQRFYVVPDSREVTLLHIGPEIPAARDSLEHFLRQAPLSNRYRTVTIRSTPAEGLTETPDVQKTPLVVIDDAVSVEAVNSLTQYLTAGGRLLFVLSEASRSDTIINTINAITTSELAVGEAQTDDYAMLSKIDFGHPLFAPMADPPYNDFSKIRFWSHREISGFSDDWAVLASFDDGNPALLETNVGAGSVWILTAGWQPSASQLALSTKFVPLIFQFFDFRATADFSGELLVGDLIPYAPSPDASIKLPDGESFDFRSTDDLAAIDKPGVYLWKDAEQSARFAVNLDQAESRTDSIDDDALEQFGVKLGSAETTEVSQSRQRQLRDRELESRQRIWQWLLVSVLGLLGLETWLGKRAHEPSVT